MLILITGASKGIGFELVKQMSQDPRNTVVAVSRKTETLSKLAKEKKTIIPLKADITKAPDRKKIYQTIHSLNLPLNILVNNAGEIVNKPFSKISEKEIKSVYNTNVFAPFLLIQILLPFFGKKKPAHIVNIGSMGGFQGSAKFPGLSAYTSSKSALGGLTECLAEELKEKNIYVNCLAIGAVQTEMLGRAFPGYQAPLEPHEMAAYISEFALNGHKFFNGKIIPVSSSTP